MDSNQTDQLVHSLAGDADLVLVNPPFGGVDRPSFALHLLQAIARQEGLKARVFYANLALASTIGELAYETICYASTGALLGERFFARAAYGSSPITGRVVRTSTHVRTSKFEGDVENLPDLYSQAEVAQEWCNEIALFLVKTNCKIIGFTSTFEQTAAAIAIAKEIKAINPSIHIMIGGANCEGEMAEGLASISTSFDQIFSGESESTFRRWCRAYAENRRADTSKNLHVAIIEGTPCMNLDDLPIVDYSDYYSQFDILLPESPLMRSGAIWLPYETSRGCWWGQKHHCTFCGINGEGMKFRQKSAGKVVDELRLLMAMHPSNKILMLDNIMPHSYFTDLLPLLASTQEKFHIFYEQKSNLDFRRVSSLKEAGVEVMQPGIEALDSNLLRHMHKGVTARQNIGLLRYALMCDIFVNWNILHSFPGDLTAWYENTVDLLPKISHLCPPTGVFGLSIDRFSPYFDQSAEFGLIDITPMPAYYDVLPANAEVNKIAYHFEASYASGSRSEPRVIEKIERIVDEWRGAWKSGDRPLCEIVELDEVHFLLMDFRPNIGRGFEFVDRTCAEMALVGMPRPVDGLTQDLQSALNWALSRQVCILIDDAVVPIATSSSELYLIFDSSANAQIIRLQSRALLRPAVVDVERPQ